ncbi:hypothetical protein Bca52824_051495 [Brassica carinata]|uniref:Uncharacterized protein n=1 Tax=Brassica carinata TaxID=52824 RepID=A0A8X7UHT5_BRACI|nr:hypothetical protein Bca52824_051495 [Brassica carinata]
MVECNARHQKVGEKPLLSVQHLSRCSHLSFPHFAYVGLLSEWEALALLLIGISVNQLCSLPEGSHVDVRQRNKCHGWTNGYGRLSSNAKPSLNAENWPLVIVVSDEV